ncbi:MAG: hypothetical protein LBC79_01270 [Deltaproteobacteria bacterium]|jgi:filamentous hemagglutinin|nr:hypothetical protein [Deltaproteobacteria bacterium]
MRGDTSLDPSLVNSIVLASDIKILGTNNVGTITVTDKISKQMPQRGWTEDSVIHLVNNPEKTVPVIDMRYNEPATAYVANDGSYVVRNDIRGHIVQVSDKSRNDWKNPWE